MLTELGSETREFGIVTIVMFVLLGLFVDIVRELILNKKK